MVLGLPGTHRSPLLLLEAVTTSPPGHNRFPPGPWLLSMGPGPHHTRSSISPANACQAPALPRPWVGGLREQDPLCKLCGAPGPMPGKHPAPREGLEVS